MPRALEHTGFATGLLNLQKLLLQDVQKVGFDFERFKMVHGLSLTGKMLAEMLIPLFTSSLSL